MRAEGRGAEDRREEVEVILSAEAAAMMCPTLFFRPLKKAARLKTESKMMMNVGWAALADQ